MQELGRVPLRLIRDNDSGIGRGKRHAEGVGAFTGTLATTLQRLKPYDPESKGIVERGSGFFETSFMPGRDFTSPADFNAQFAQWLAIANARTVRTFKARPVDLLEPTRRQCCRCHPWPRRSGGSTGSGWAATLRPPRQQRLLRGPGRFVDVTADLAKVEVRHEGRLVAVRDRVRARGMTITEPAHVKAAKVLREQYQRPCPPSDPHDELIRDLADYDRAFGLIDGALAGGEVA